MKKRPVLTTLVTIERGVYTSMEALRAAMTEAGCDISRHTRIMMAGIWKDFPINQDRVKVELVKVSESDLELPEDYTLEDVISAGAGIGLDKCQPEDAALAGIAYADSERREELLFVMDLLESDGETDFFDLLMVPGYPRCLCVRLWPGTTKFHGRFDRQWIFARQK